MLALDVAIFNQAYGDNQLKHFSELVGGDSLARLLLTSLRLFSSYRRPLPTNGRGRAWHWRGRSTT